MTNENKKTSRIRWALILSALIPIIIIGGMTSQQKKPRPLDRNSQEHEVPKAAVPESDESLNPKKTSPIELLEKRLSKSKGMATTARANLNLIKERIRKRVVIDAFNDATIWDFAVESLEFGIANPGQRTDDEILGNSLAQIQSAPLLWKFKQDLKSLAQMAIQVRTSDQLVFEAKQNVHHFRMTNDETYRAQIEAEIAKQEAERLLKEEQELQAKKAQERATNEAAEVLRQERIEAEREELEREQKAAEDARKLNDYHAQLWAEHGESMTLTSAPQALASIAEAMQKKPEYWKDPKWLRRWHDKEAEIFFAATNHIIKNGNLLFHFANRSHRDMQSSWQADAKTIDEGLVKHVLAFFAAEGAEYRIQQRLARNPRAKPVGSREFWHAVETAQRD